MATAESHVRKYDFQNAAHAILMLYQPHVPSSQVPFWEFLKMLIDKCPQSVSRRSLFDV